MQRPDAEIAWMLWHPGPVTNARLRVSGAVLGAFDHLGRDIGKAEARRMQDARRAPQLVGAELREESFDRLAAAGHAQIAAAASRPSSRIASVWLASSKRVRSASRLCASASYSASAGIGAAIEIGWPVRRQKAVVAGAEDREMVCRRQGTVLTGYR
jgi:hypothetical protein